MATIYSLDSPVILANGDIFDFLFCMVKLPVIELV